MSHQSQLNKLFPDGKMLMLAYDQGVEHGPQDFNEVNWDPTYILDIAKRGNYDSVALHYGSAAKFWKPDYADIPLVLKLNGKTILGRKPYSTPVSNVEDAAELGATAVGYTIYVGSEFEADMFWQFGEIRREAHRNGLAVIAWIYPFITMPSSNDDERDAEIIAYGARIGAELGADVLKLKYPHQPERLDWIIKNAVGTKVVLSGGHKTESETEFLDSVGKFMKAGGNGVAVGRNVWQHNRPLEMSAMLRESIGRK